MSPGTSTDDFYQGQAVAASSTLPTAAAPKAPSKGKPSFSLEDDFFLADEHLEEVPAAHALPGWTPVRAVSCPEQPQAAAKSDDTYLKMTADDFFSRGADDCYKQSRSTAATAATQRARRIPEEPREIPATGPETVENDSTAQKIRMQHKAGNLRMAAVVGVLSVLMLLAAVLSIDVGGESPSNANPLSSAQDANLDQRRQVVRAQSAMASGIPSPFPNKQNHEMAASTGKLVEEAATTVAVALSTMSPSAVSASASESTSLAASEAATIAQTAAEPEHTNSTRAMQTESPKANWSVEDEVRKVTGRFSEVASNKGEVDVLTAVGQALRASSSSDTEPDDVTVHNVDVRAERLELSKLQAFAQAVEAVARRGELEGAPLELLELLRLPALAAERFAAEWLGPSNESKLKQEVRTGLRERRERHARSLQEALLRFEAAVRADSAARAFHQNQRT